MIWHDWAFKWLWTNDGVGNFTASAVVFALGGRWVWVRHVKPHLDRIHHLHTKVDALHTKVDGFSETPPTSSS